MQKIMKITGKDLIKAGISQGTEIGRIISLVEENDVKDTDVFLDSIKDYLSGNFKNIEDSVLTQAINILEEAKTEREQKNANKYDLKDEGCPTVIYGESIIEKNAIDQITIASRLPCSVQAACMPDAHPGYGLPIGGVLATENVVIPYGVGVDIGCRMCLSIYEEDPSRILGGGKEFKNALVENTFFGKGCENDGNIENTSHEILADARFKNIPYVKSNNLHKKAVAQLGTSGGGNHFAEFGIVHYRGKDSIAILTHSGSRGVGANIANFYTNLAMEKCKLPKNAQRLAYFDLDTEEGQEYWEAMNLAGDFASACHHVIHDRLSKKLRLKRIDLIENHHNFAWKETLHDGREVIVHRKGATPAGKGILGVIPGSMTTNTYIVKGKGHAGSINSSSHGAGRIMSRKAARGSYTVSAMKKNLADNGVTLIGGAVDECTFAYKNIDDVMALQSDLIEVIGIFSPKVVRMA